MGKFKFLFQDEAEDLEEGDKFKLAIVQNKLLGPVKYVDKNGKDPEVLKIYGKDREEGEGFSKPDINIPGVLDYFTVVWSNPFGDLFVDQDIKLFEFEDIQKYSTYNDGPISKEFCRFYTSSTSKELDGFDSSIFWSAGLLYKHFKTCGVEKWDQQFKDLIEHYRNWKAWTHEVHNLPNNNNNSNKKFSDNPYSGPATTSTSYSREKKRLPMKIRNSVECSSKPDIVVNPASNVSAGITPVLNAPPTGQTVLVPIVGSDGNLVHVQLSTLPSQSAVSPSPAGPTTSRYKYINPHMVPNILNLNTSQPPPGYQPNTCESKSSWTNQVEDFLSRPAAKRIGGDEISSSNSCSPVSFRGSSTSRSEDISQNEFRKRNLKHTLDPSKEKNREIKNPLKINRTEQLNTLEKARARIEAKRMSKFTPKASIMPPSPSDKSEVNELDIMPEHKLYKGEIMDWRGKFGYISCPNISGKIFVHSKDVLDGRECLKTGAKATFQVLHQDSSVVGAKAVNVKISL